MFAFLRNWLRLRAYRRLLHAPSSSPYPPHQAPPPTPDGWRIVPHATPGITAYEVSAMMPLHAPRPAAPQPGPGWADMCGRNATMFHGFPPDTLEIGRVDVHIVPGIGIQITYRFDYDPRGQKPKARIPLSDFHRLLLPLPAEQPLELAHG